MSPAAARLIGAALVAAALLAAAPWAPAAEPAADRGAQLYERGEARADGVEVATSAAPVERLSARGGNDGAWVLRGAVVACANCHGLNGQGGGEGWQRAPTLRWPEWSSGDAAVRAAALQRFRRALRDGRGASGQPLATAMPRFDLDDAALDALAAHVARLTTAAPADPVPVFALLRRTDAAAPAFENAVHQRLQQCLQERLGTRIQLETHAADAPAQALSTWARLQQRPEVVAALAPAWRDWRPPPDATKHVATKHVATNADANAATALPSLFPLSADPLPDAAAVHWLFGGERARAVALLLAWLVGRDERSVAVWPGAGAEGERRWRLLDALAQDVAHEAGQQMRFERLPTPTAPPGRAALWWAENERPTPGWWLVPEALQPAPPPGARWWMAQPYPGRALRPLAQRWADATCLTLVAVMSQTSRLDRAGWAQHLAATGRLNDGQGWEWRIPVRVGSDFGADFGAATGWSVIEFNAGGGTRVVTPRVDVAH